MEFHVRRRHPSAGAILPSERARAQGAAEMLRYAATALATLAAGPTLDAFGWEALNAAMLPVILAAGLMT
jgi:hypothetical protein